MDILLKIKLVDPTLPLPQYQSPGAAALDLYARETVTILPNQVEKIPLNVVLEIPSDHWVLLAARSSLHKKGLILANGIGVGDADFCGDEDEYRAALWNRTDAPVVVERGERIVQMIVLSRPKVTIEQVSKMTKKSRGGFGSTGSGIIQA